MENKLKELRKERKLTQEDLGKIFSIGKSTLCQYENGDREPSLALLSRFADYFNVSLDYLLGRCDKKWNESSSFTNGEERLLSAFRGLLPPMQDYVIEMVEKLVETPQSLEQTGKKRA